SLIQILTHQMMILLSVLLFQILPTIRPLSLLILTVVMMRTMSLLTQVKNLPNLSLILLVP
ncbi:hypothetical protein KI387_020898, partial [Taxus chinensis]